MNQNVWGPPAWFFLHTVTFNYPLHPQECDKERNYQFFISLQDIIPCRYCRENYKRHLVEYPIRLESRKELVYWLIDVHNSVNSLTGKKTVSYQEAVKIWENKLGKKLILEEKEDDNDPCMATFGTVSGLSSSIWLNYLVIMVVLIAFIWFFYNRR